MQTPLRIDDHPVTLEDARDPHPLDAEPLDAEPLDAEPLDPADARARVEAAALHDGGGGRVGLELEGHLVDLAAPAHRVPWGRLSAAVADLPPLPGGSRVTLEPGGQVELSGPPLAGVADAVAALRCDEEVLRFGLGEHGLGWAVLGADPLRPVGRVSPGARYVAMEEHFTATGRRVPGLAMMTSTAALQVNLDAGPAHEHAARVARVHRLGPVLVALGACSPWLAGRPTGWRSTRQQVWGALDPRRTGPLPGGPDPAAGWAAYALAAPVLLVRGPGDSAAPVRTSVPFERWLGGEVRLSGRTPTAADLDYHLTTLFPPVRLRGFLELRFLDAAPGRWWGALAAVTATLVDHPVAAAAADAVLEEAIGPADAAPPEGPRSAGDGWTRAARLGLDDPTLHRAALACLAVAASHVDAGLRSDVEALADLVACGRSPGHDLDERCRAAGPLAALATTAGGT